MDFIDNEFCEDTPLRENKCSLCGKKLAYVDSPFGSIPSLELIKKFYKDFKKYFEQQKKDLEKYTKNEIIDVSKEKQEVFDAILNENKRKMEEIDKELEKKLSEIDLSLEKKVGMIQLRHNTLNSFTNQIYNSFSEILTFFSELIDILVSLTDDLDGSREEFKQNIKPQLEYFVNSLDLLQNVIPNEEIYSTGIQRTPIENIFELNQNFASEEEFFTKRKSFEDKWEQMSIDLNSSKIEKRGFYD